MWSHGSKARADQWVCSDSQPPALQRQILPKQCEGDQRYNPCKRLNRANSTQISRYSTGKLNAHLRSSFWPAQSASYFVSVPLTDRQYRSRLPTLHSQVILILHYQHLEQKTMDKVTFINSMTAISIGQYTLTVCKWYIIVCFMFQALLELHFFISFFFWGVYQKMKCYNCR